MEDYKKEIAATRVGCLGSSDGRMLAQIASLKSIPKSAYKRLAVVKGLIPQEEIPITAAVQAGNDIEMIIYNHLKSQDPRYESNPLWVSQKHSKKNCKLISHPDLVLKDDANKTLNIYEVKTTKFSIAQTRSHYEAQLFIHKTIGTEIANEFGKGWKVNLYLVHYNTDGLDLTKGVEFDPLRLTINRVLISSSLFDIENAMTIVNGFLETFTEYYEGDEVDADLLPAPIREQMTNVAAMLLEIKQREEKVDEFKKKLYDFMLAHDVKSIKNEYFSIVLVNDTESHSFDYKNYLDDMKKKYPRKTKKIIEQYTKTTKRKGYCTIKVKSDK